MEGIVNASVDRMNGSHLSPLPPQRLVSIADRSILCEEAFRRMHLLETKRAQRSGKPFLLSLLEMESHLSSEKTRTTLGKILSVLDSITRDTDVTGWYKDESIVGVMFTEIATEDRSSILSTVMSRVSRTLRGHLTPQQFTQLGISFHVFPEEQGVERIVPSANVPPLFAETFATDDARRLR
jgi:hypothetical protein